MSAHRMRRIGANVGAATVFCLVALAAPPAAARPEKIGVASAVVPHAEGAPPNAQPVVLRVGKDMVVDERVTTGEEGRAQLLFVDGSALMVGPNSDLVLDSYVFDAAAGRGEATFSAARGVFRLVGGKLTKSSPVTIRTPTATVGVRGGIALIEVGAEGTSATFLFGEQMTVTSGGVTKVVARPGYTIEADGERPTDPRPAPAEALSDKLASLEASASAPVEGPEITDEDVAERQTMLREPQLEPAAAADVGSPGLSEPAARPRDAEAARMPVQLQPIAFAEDVAGAFAPEVAALAGAPAPCVGLCIGGLSGRGVTAAGQNVGLALATIGDGVFRASGYEIVAPGPGAFSIGPGQPAVTPLGPAIGGGELAGAFVLYKLEGANGLRQIAFAGAPLNAVPTSGVEAFRLDEDFLRQSNLPFVDPLPGAEAGKAFLAWDASTPGAQRAFAGGAVAIHGQGTSQQSASYALFGSVLTDAAGRPFISGRMEGWGRDSATGAPTLYDSYVSSVDGGDGSDFFGVEGARRFVLSSERSDAADAPLGGAVTRAVGQAVSSFASYTAAAPVAYAPAPRTSRTLSGFMSGVERRLNGDGTQLVATFNADPANVAIASDTTRNVVSASFLLADGGGSTLDLRFGETAPSGRSAFIDDDVFVAAASEVRRDGAPVDGRGALLTSAFLTQSGLLPAGVEFCACDYLVWGFASVDRQSAANSPVSDRTTLELANFVAGELSDSSQLVGLPNMSATYRGHLIASVVNSAGGGAPKRYTAVGAIDLAFTFGGGSYTLDSVTISNFDGANLSGAGGAAASSSNRYASAGMTIAGTHPSAGAVMASLEGAFFGPGSPPANAAGQARIWAPDYLAAGVFAAERSGP